MKRLLLITILVNCLTATTFYAQEEKSVFLQKVDKYGADRSLSNEDKIKFLDSVINVSTQNAEFEPLAYSFYHKAFALYAMRKDVDSVYFCMKSALNFARKNKDHNLCSNIYAKYAQLLAIQENNELALVYCDSSIIASKKINYLYGSFSAHLTKARIYTVTGDLDMALEEIYNAEDYADNAYDSLAITERIASVYVYKSDFKKSEYYHNEVIDFSLNQKNKKDSINALQWMANLANVYDNLNLQIKRKEQLHKALIVSENLGEPHLRANVMKQFAEYHLNVSKQIDSSEFYLNTINRELPEIREPDFLADLNQTRGDFYAIKKQFNEAIQFYSQTYEYNKNVNHLEKIKSITLKLSAIYDSLGNHESALQFYKEYVGINDSLVNKEEIEKFKEIELTNQFDKEKLANDLVYQKEIAEERESKLYLIAGLSVLGLLILFVLYAYRKQRKQSKVLDEKNSVIEQSLSEKQLLLKEIHHRVKNNFQIVSSLLELQSKGIKDDKAKKLAQEGQNRVKSMALIHQKLYQNDDLTINFLEYLEQLVKEMINMFATSEINSSVVAEKDIHFDIDTLIPLGLILNELLTNSFKYGLNDDEENSLLVKLEKVSDEFYELTVKDSGQGIPDTISIGKHRSLGLRLIRRLSKQLHGNVSYSFNEGAQFKIRFKDQQMRLRVE